MKRPSYIRKDGKPVGKRLPKAQIVGEYDFTPKTLEELRKQIQESKYKTQKKWTDWDQYLIAKKREEELLDKYKNQRLLDPNSYIKVIDEPIRRQGYKVLKASDSDWRNIKTKYVDDYGVRGEGAPAGFLGEFDRRWGPTNYYTYNTNNLKYLKPITEKIEVPNYSTLYNTLKEKFPKLSEKDLKDVFEKKVKEIEEGKSQDYVSENFYLDHGLSVPIAYSDKAGLQTFSENNPHISSYVEKRYKPKEGQKIQFFKPERLDHSVDDFFDAYPYYMHPEIENVYRGEMEDIHPIMPKRKEPELVVRPPVAVTQQPLKDSTFHSYALNQLFPIQKGYWEYDIPIERTYSQELLEKKKRHPEMYLPPTRVVRDKDGRIVAERKRDPYTGQETNISFGEPKEESYYWTQEYLKNLADKYPTKKLGGSLPEYQIQGALDFRKTSREKMMEEAARRKGSYNIPIQDNTYVKPSVKTIPIQKAQQKAQAKKELKEANKAKDEYLKQTMEMFPALKDKKQAEQFVLSQMEREAKGPDQLRETPKAQSKVGKFIDVAANPFLALDTYRSTGTLPDYFAEKDIPGTTGMFDIPYMFTGLGLIGAGAKAAKDIPYELAEGDYLGAGLDATMLIPGMRSARKMVKSPAGRLSKRVAKKAGKYLTKPFRALDDINLNTSFSEYTPSTNLYKKSFNPEFGAPLGTAEDLANKSAIQYAGNKPYLFNPENNTWERLADKINNKYSQGYTDIPQFNEELKRLKATAMFGKRPLLSRADFVLSREEQLADRLLFEDFKNWNIDFSSGKPEFIRRTGDGVKDIMERAAEQGLTPDDILKRVLIKLGNKKGLPLQEPMYFNPANPKSATRAVIYSNPDYAQTFGKQFKETGSLGGRLPSQENLVLMNQIRRYENMLKEFPDHPGLQDKISKYYQMLMKNYSQKGAKPFTGIEALQSIQPNKKGGQFLKYSNGGSISYKKKDGSVISMMKRGGQFPKYQIEGETTSKNKKTPWAQIEMPNGKVKDIYKDNPEDMELYAKAYKEGRIARPFVDDEGNFGLFAPELEEVKITPKYSEWEKENPKEDFIRKKKQEYLKNTPEGLRKAYNINEENFPEDVLAGYNSEYNYLKNEAAGKKIIDKYKGNANDRTTWVDQLTDEERNTISRSPYAYQLNPNIFAKAYTGAKELMGLNDPLKPNFGYTQKEHINREKGILNNLGDVFNVSDYPGYIAYGLMQNPYKKTPIFSGQIDPNAVEGSYSVLNPFNYLTMSEGLKASSELPGLLKNYKNYRKVRKSAKELLNEYKAQGMDSDPHYHLPAYLKKKEEILKAISSPEGRARLQNIIDNNKHYQNLNLNVDQIINDFDKTKFSAKKPWRRRKPGINSHFEDQIKKLIDEGKVDPEWAYNADPSLNKTDFVIDKQGNAVWFDIDPENAFSWYLQGIDKPSFVGIGKSYTPYDAAHVLEHEFAHLFQRGAPLSGIDDELAKITTKTADYNPWPLTKTEIRKKKVSDFINKLKPKTKDVDISRTGDIFGIGLNEEKRARDINRGLEYWNAGGGSAQEKAAFAAEIRENLLQRGLLENRYDPITPELLEKHFNLYHRTGNNKYYLRLYEFLDPKNKDNFKFLANALNKMPAVIPAVGAGALGVGALENQKYGGSFSKYQTTGEVPHWLEGAKWPYRIEDKAKRDDVIKNFFYRVLEDSRGNPSRAIANMRGLNSAYGTDRFKGTGKDLGDYFGFDYNDIDFNLLEDLGKEYINEKQRTIVPRHNLGTYENPIRLPEVGVRPKYQNGNEVDTPEEWEKEIRAVEHKIGNPSGWTLENYNELQNKLNEYKNWRENTPKGKAVIDYHNEPNEYVVPLPSHLKKVPKKKGGPIVTTEGFKMGPPPQGSYYRIPSDTLYNPTDYTIEAIADTGERKVLKPRTGNTKFDGASYVDEYQMKKGGQLRKYQTDGEVYMNTYLMPPEDDKEAEAWFKKMGLWDEYFPKDKKPAKDLKPENKPLPKAKPLETNQTLNKTIRDNKYLPSVPTYGQSIAAKNVGSVVQPKTEVLVTKEDGKLWDANVEQEVLNRQKYDNTRYGKFDKRGKGVMNRTDKKRNADSEKFFEDYAKPNSVIIDIGSALGNTDPSLAGVSVYEVASNPNIKKKNVKVIATDVPSEIATFMKNKQSGKAYPIDFAEVPLDFMTPVSKILKTKKLDSTKDVYLRAANSIDLLMSPEQTVEHFKHLANSLKDKNVTYLFNNVILKKPQGSSKFQKVGNLNNASFDHNNPSWRTKTNRKAYELTGTPLKKGGVVKPKISYIRKDGKSVVK